MTDHLPGYVSALYKIMTDHLPGYVSALL
jgi:hypothetical protein